LAVQRSTVEYHGAFVPDVSHKSLFACSAAKIFKRAYLVEFIPFR
jgi:hypothetical protein